VKGIELPINILVVVAVAVIVLLGVVALYFSGWFSGTAPMTLEAAKAQACNIASRQGCGVGVDTLVTITVDYGTATNLDTLCSTYYQIDDNTMCVNSVCGMNC
jgi:hypothetical protein